MSSIAATAAPVRKLTMEPGHDARARKSMRSVSTYRQKNLISPFSALSEQIENRRFWLHRVPDRPISMMHYSDKDLSFFGQPVRSLLGLVVRVNPITYIHILYSYSFFIRTCLHALTHSKSI